MRRREKRCIDIIRGKNKKEGIFERNGYDWGAIKGRR